MKRLAITLCACFLSYIIGFSQPTGSCKTEGVVNAYLKGRSTEGSLPRPSFNVQESGTVVVTIWVDNYGKVVKAQAGAEGTTVTDKSLWAAARNAAMGTRFKQKVDAPAMQQGTITYVFRTNSECEISSENVSVREIVDNCQSGTYTTRAFFVETYDYDKLVFLIESEDYIIPVQLVKDDLGAEKRFRSLNLNKGDVVSVTGELQKIRIDEEFFKGLSKARILDIEQRKEEDEVDKTDPEQVAFQLVEEKPSFQGGDANEFSKWVNSQLVYPANAKKNGVQGRVVLQYTITTEGNITDVKILRGVDPELDQEAVRVVSNSPKWEPGKAGGKPVPVVYTFPVIFQLR